ILQQKLLQAWNNSRHYGGDVTLKTACTVSQQEAGDEDCGIVEGWAIQSLAGLSDPLAIASYTAH
ncbi:hypothetical protein F2P79_017153, partial [Pimephales promelas]